MTRAMPVTPPQWSRFAKSFSRAHDGWASAIELHEADGEMEVVVDDRPFRGISCERHGDHDTLILSFGDDPDEHLSHLIEEPRAMTLLENDHSHVSLVIDLEDGSGCVLELSNPCFENEFERDSE